MEHMIDFSMLIDTLGNSEDEPAAEIVRSVRVRFHKPARQRLGERKAAAG